MKEPRKVRGLMDFVEAEASGEAWEFEEPSPDYIPGMGLGATKEAMRWAWMGYCVEKMLKINLLSKRKRGRPKKDVIQSKDAVRAFTLWRLAQRYDAASRSSLSNRFLIKRALEIEDILDIPTRARAFPEGNHEASVSRGKKALGIDPAWQSKLCEELDRI